MKPATSGVTACERGGGGSVVAVDTQRAFQLRLRDGVQAATQRTAEIFEHVSALPTNFEMTVEEI